MQRGSRFRCRARRELSLVEVLVAVGICAVAVVTKINTTSKGNTALAMDSSEFWKVKGPTSLLNYARPGSRSDTSLCLLKIFLTLVSPMKNSASRPTITY